MNSILILIALSIQVNFKIRNIVILYFLVNNSVLLVDQDRSIPQIFISDNVIPVTILLEDHSNIGVN